VVYDVKGLITVGITQEENIDVTKAIRETYWEWDGGSEGEGGDDEWDSE
jgi:hypothetical protein